MFVQVDHADGVEPAQDELDGNGPPAETRTPSPSRSSGSDRDAYRLGSPNGTRRRPERARARGARPPVRRDPRTRIRRRQSRGRRSRLGLAGKESPAGTPPGARGRSLRSRHQGAKPAVVLLVCSLPWLPITQPRLRLRHFDEPAKDEVELDRHGFSHHSVPPLSKTATRSSTGTASVPERVRSTKSRMACFAAPSRQLQPDRRGHIGAVSSNAHSSATCGSAAATPSCSATAATLANGPKRSVACSA
jgi:hypothetical protein